METIASKISPQRSVNARQFIAPATLQQIRLLQHPSNRSAITDVAILIAMIAPGVSAALSGLHLAITMCGIIVIAFAMIRSGFMLHDATHGTLAHNATLNRLTGEFCGILVAYPFTMYSFFHMKHHAYERTDRDPGNLEMYAQKWGVHPTIVHWIILFVGMELSMLQTTLTGLWMVIRNRRMDIAAEYVGVALFFASIVLVGSWTVFLYVWLLPFLVASCVMNIRIISEHELPVSTTVQFQRTRTVLTNRVFSWLLYNGNYHLEHHLFPKVPARYLPELHAILSKDFQIHHSMIEIGYRKFMMDFLRQIWIRYRTRTMEKTSD